MKTTVHVSDALFRRASQLAKKEGTTFRALVEEGLRRVIEEHQQRAGFQLRDASFGEGGLRPEFENTGWEKIRDAIYEGRGS